MPGTPEGAQCSKEMPHASYETQGATVSGYREPAGTVGRELSPTRAMVPASYRGDPLKLALHPLPVMQRGAGKDREKTHRALIR